jgi:2,4-dienoyl-CoA reductase-like NADH-dependent reductase (Old Yellow Enzyme family)
MDEPALFSPIALREVRLRNRIVVSSMCQYSSEDGFATDWHLVHLGSRAIGGAALVMTEAAAVEERGRISPNDLGIWDDQHIQSLAPIARFIQAQGAVPGIQLAHAGRKASTARPWEGGRQIPAERGGWRPVAPSPIPFLEDEVVPEELSVPEFRRIVTAFAAAARRASEAGFRVAEIHSAHGYLLHEFLSPLTNRRTDEYGGPLGNRIRALCEVTWAVREAWPASYPLFVRISATDWAEDGWDEDQSVRLAQRLKPLGVDLIDCSSGGLLPHVAVPVAPGYQVPFAEKIRQEAGIATGAVGLITEPEQANEIVASGKADLVFLAREMLRDPYWPLHAARRLGLKPAPPVPYRRAF